jgi:hypothetical protein
MQERYTLYGTEWREHGNGLKRWQDMTGRSQMQGGKNWIFPKEIMQTSSSETLIDWSFESIAMLPPFGTIEGHKWFDQISSQWESQKNRFAFISFGKNMFLPPCIWNLPFMTYRFWKNNLCPFMGPNGGSVANRKGIDLITLHDLSFELRRSSQFLRNPIFENNPQNLSL